MSNTDEELPRAVGINHVALPVEDVEQAVDFYGSLFAVDLRGRTDHAAFIDMGDQFIALAAGETAADETRHIGLVVDDRDAVERRLEETGVERLETNGLDFHDPWGNRIQVVEYAEVQFSKTDAVLEGMGLDLAKTDAALAELAAKGMAPDDG
ncbi:VOC family protein [Halosegnis sp.]|uniref:VOC family protein n=1 Tax=Halosegnis sp. TaxID=2864959 RepID=UPI0035D475A4